MRLVAVLATTIVLGVAPATADDLDDARRLEATLEYEQGLTLVTRALARGGAEPARLIELHLLAGKLAAGLDRVTVAEDHFARALALRPTATLPDGTSPKLTTPFDAARGRTRPLVVTPRVIAGLASVTAAADPLGLVVGIAARVVDSSGRHDELVARNTTRLSIPATVTVIELAALDASGNRVWIGVAPVAPAIDPTDEPSPSIFVRWPTWAITTGVLVSIGGLCAWRGSSLQDDWNRLRAEVGQHDYSRLVELETRGRRYAFAANLSFGLATAALVTTAIMFARGDRTTTRVAITAGFGSLGVAGQF